MINSKFLMTLSAVILGLLGICLIFLPNEITHFIGISPAKFITLILQIIGAMYFAFAVLNWTAKDSLIGGIYNRPIAVGNFTHFLIGGLTLLKTAFSGQLQSIIWLICIFYLLLAISFGSLLFRHPIAKTEQ
jgi:hypothetical protein